MQYDFNVINDKLVCTKRDTPLTGNVNTYRCVFQIESTIENLHWFCVFKRDGEAYVQPILNGECFIPREVLVREGGIKIGCYGTNLKQDDYKRVSTNWVYFNSLEGAYSEASVPEVPEPDLWEELVLKSVPMIGENGNWFIYDMSQGKYVDTEVKADTKDDRVGFKLSTTGSEIFNDYDNNTSNIPYAHVEGRNNKANVKTFLIDDGAENYLTGNSITLKSVDGIAVGMPWDIFTVENGTQWKYHGFVTDVKGNTVYTEDKKLPTKVTPAKSGSFLNTFIVSGGSIGNVEITDYTGDFSAHVEGRNNVAVLDAHAEGTATNALGYSSHAEGRKTIASGECSHAEGYGGIASGEGSHVEGAAETASGHYAHAEGYYTNATGAASHAEGNGTTASGKNAHSEGSGTTASGVYAHAEGEYTTASGYAAHTEGHRTEAWNTGSHAEGYYAKAEGHFTHAEGKQTRAVGECSHAEGLNTWAMSKNQHVEGSYNVADDKEIYVHIVGNGSADKRSNAHTLDWSGNAWYAGSVEATSIILKSPNGTRFKITVNDNGALSTAKV